MKSALLFAVLTLAAHAQSVPCVAPIKTGVTATTYTDSTISDGSVYFYAVAAVDVNGNTSTCSNTVTATISTTGTHTVSLTWTASTSSGVTYSVFRAQAPAPPTNLTVTVN